MFLLFFISPGLGTSERTLRNEPSFTVNLQHTTRRKRVFYDGRRDMRVPVIPSPVVASAVHHCGCLPIQYTVCERIQFGPQLNSIQGQSGPCLASVANRRAGELCGSFWSFTKECKPEYSFVCLLSSTTCSVCVLCRSGWSCVFVFVCVGMCVNSIAIVPFFVNVFVALSNQKQLTNTVISQQRCCGVGL